MKKTILTYIGIVVGFLILSYAFVPQVLSGRIVNQSDISGWQGMAHEMMEWNAQNPDNQTAWTGSMFSGMPTTTIRASTKGDWTQFLYDFLLTGRRPATYLFVSLLGAFLLMLSLGVSPLIAAGGAVAVTFCAYNMQIIQVGHNTKMQALAFLPWVLASLIFTYRSALKSKENARRGLAGMVLGASMFGLCLSFQIKANHPQISYYLALMIILYVLVMFIWLMCSAERRKLAGRFLAASALLLVLGCAGIATNAVKLLPTWEYTPYSMRGGSSSPSAEGDGSRGLKLDYATAWSYGWEELPNLLIPNFNGGSSSGAVNIKKSETYKLLRDAGQPNCKEVCRNLPLYWGPQPFTAGPMYMGAVTIFLFVLGLCICKGKDKWWLVAATVLAVFLSLGSNFMWFTRLFYDYAPLYNKFRTVSMALVILQFTLPALGFLALDRIVRDPASAAALTGKLGRTALGITFGFCLVFALFPSLAGSFTGAVDAGQPDVLSDALAADRRSLLVSDAWRSICLICGSYALIWWGCSVPKSASASFAKNPEMGFSRRRTAALLVCILLLADLTIVGKRYLNSTHFTTPRAFNDQFRKRPVDEMILTDPDPSYRVLDLSVNVFNDSHPSYWHKNIGGYSPAKLQRYQEYIESHLQGEISSLHRAISAAAATAGDIGDIEAALPQLEGLSNLNCRYIILDAKMPPLVYPYARGNAWFEDGDAGSIGMTSYAPNELRYSYSSPAGGKAVFSEVYYPEGWTAVLDDGTPLPISLSDDILRAVELPSGDHELVMRFEPASYLVGERVSRASSIILILLVLLSVAGAAIFGNQ